jgi:hypothetical protein
MNNKALRTTIKAISQGAIASSLLSELFYYGGTRIHGMWERVRYEHIFYAYTLYMKYSPHKNNSKETPMVHLWCFLVGDIEEVGALLGTEVGSDDGTTIFDGAGDGTMVG